MGGLANFALLYYVQPLLPTLAARYDVRAGTSAQALSVSTLAMAVALIGIGPLSDAVGRVNVLRWSLAASGALGLASAFVTSWPALLVLRALMGVALAGLPAVALAYLREEIHPSAHPQANAAYIAGTATGGALGRLLPGPLDAWGGWTFATCTIAGVTLVAALAVTLLVPPSTGFTPTPPRVRAVLGGMGRTVRDPVVLALCLVGFAGMGAFVGIYNAIAFRLQAPPYELGHAATLVYLAYPVGIAGPTVARLLAARLGRWPATVLLVAGMAVGTLVVGAGPLPLVMAGLGLLTFAFLGTHSLATAWVVDRARRTGVGTAQASSGYLLAYYTGSAAIGVTATHLWSQHGWLAVTTLSLVLAALAAAGATLAARGERPGPGRGGEGAGGGTTVTDALVPEG
ncbi:MAG: MFS transporter [Actinobacteria bacterium]|nr:MFS transporter [Actinomycetota bacterium]